METERYIITFFGINTKYYTVDFVAYLWDKYAEKEYHKSGTYVTCLIEVRKLVCGVVRGCDLGEEAHVITAVRNPIDASNIDVYFDSLRNVIQDVREELGNPNMTISTQKIQYNYFLQP